MYDQLYPCDPNYESEPARFLIEAVRTLTGYTVIPSADLEQKLLEVRHGPREVHIRTGQLFPKFHTLIGRTTLFIVGGSSWAPEFHIRPKLTVVRDMPK